MDRIARIGASLLTATRVIAAIWVMACFAIMTLSVWTQVGGRYFFNYSIAWTGELATIAQIWMVLVGAGIAVRRDMHARIDFVLTLLSKPIRRAVSLATLLLALWFLYAITRGAIPLMSLGRFQTTPALGIPLLVPYLGLVVGPVYFAVELCAAAFASWNGEPGDKRRAAAETSL